MNTSSPFGGMSIVTVAIQYASRPAAQSSAPTTYVRHRSRPVPRMVSNPASAASRTYSASARGSAKRA